MFKWFQKKTDDQKETTQKETEKASSEPKEPSKGKGLWQRFQEGLSRTRERLKEGLGELFIVERIVDEAFFEELEEALITADINIDTVRALLAPLRLKVKDGQILKSGECKRYLREEMLKILSVPCPEFPPSARPAAVFLVGVNGVGKTTTIAKLAHLLQEQGHKVLLVAADTFRAAAIEQLETWGERLGVPVIKQSPGADPSSVVFDGLKVAKKRAIDVALIDTAGRLHTKYNLMEELKKMARVAGKVLPGAPHENLLVIDATTGQNAVNQVRLFGEALPLTGLILTKMDGTAKGGIALTLAHLFGLPIRFVGLGEKIDDLNPFDPEAFVDAILP